MEVSYKKLWKELVDLDMKNGNWRKLPELAIIRSIN